MRVVSMPALNKGAVIMEFAFSRLEKSVDLDTADLIGIVAAYIARGYYTNEIEERLKPVLGPDLASAARKTYQTFEDWAGRGLWSQGPAGEDIVFTDDKLRKMYPDVGMEMERPADAMDLYERQFARSDAT